MWPQCRGTRRPSLPHQRNGPCNTRCGPGRPTTGPHAPSNDAADIGPRTALGRRVYDHLVTLSFEPSTPGFVGVRRPPHPSGTYFRPWGSNPGLCGGWSPITQMRRHSAKGRTGDCPRPRKETSEARNATRGGQSLSPHRKRITATAKTWNPENWLAPGGGGGGGQ